MPFPIDSIMSSSHFYPVTMALNNDICGKLLLRKRNCLAIMIICHKAHHCPACLLPGNQANHLQDADTMQDVTSQAVPLPYRLISVTDPRFASIIKCPSHRIFFQDQHTSLGTISIRHGQPTSNASRTRRAVGARPASANYTKNYSNAGRDYP